MFERVWWCRHIQRQVVSHTRNTCGLHAAIDLIILVVPGAVQVQKRTQGKVEPKGKEEAAKRGPTTPSPPPPPPAPAAAASFFPFHE